MELMPSWTLAPAGTFGEFRYVSGTNCHQRFVELPCPPDRLTRVLQDAALSARQGWNVYYGLNPRRRPCGKAEAVACTTAVFIDVDAQVEAEAAATVSRIGAAPSIVVGSGHGYHCYWLLDSAYGCEKVQQVARRMCMATGSDPVWSPAQAPRLPGSFNWKTRPPLPVRVLAASMRRYSLVELAIATPKVELAPLPTTHAVINVTPLTRAEMAMLQMPTRLRWTFENYRVLDRSRADAALAVWAVEAGWPDERIVSLLASPAESKLIERMRRQGVPAAQRYLTSTLRWARSRAMPQAQATVHVTGVRFQ